MTCVKCIILESKSGTCKWSINFCCHSPFLPRVTVVIQAWLYRNNSTHTHKRNDMLQDTISCIELSPVNMAKKYGLHAAIIFLWQGNFWSSTQITTSQRVFVFLCSFRPCKTVNAWDCSRNTYSLKSPLRNKPEKKNYWNLKSW